VRKEIHTKYAIQMSDSVDTP